MARKRGGLAGIWDRNKGIIKTAVPAALSFIPGAGIPLAAAAGAAMEGLDRPGKRGIGLDPLAAARGGVSGAAIGASTAAAKAGISSLFAPKAAAPAISQFATPQVGQGFFPGGIGGSAMANPFAAPAAAPANFAALSAASSPVSTASRLAGDVASTTGGDKRSSGGSRIMDLLRGTKNNWEMISEAGKGLNAMLGMQGQEAMARQKLEQDRRDFEQRMAEFNARRAETEAERESRRRLTQLLMPLFQAQMTNVLPPNPVVPR